MNTLAGYAMPRWESAPDKPDVPDWERIRGFERL